MTFDTSFTNTWRLNTNNNLFFNKDEQTELYSEIVREGTQGYSKFSSINETPEIYQSTKNSLPFETNVYSIDPSKVKVFISDNNNPRMREFITEREILFPLHPGNDCPPKIDVFKTHSIAKKINVFPTASTRTVRLWNNSREAFKLDLHKRISRFDRRLGPGTIGHSVEVSKRLSNYLSSASSSNTAILEEGFGAAFITSEPGDPKLKGWGFLHRNFELHPLINEKTYSIPLFALYGIDPNAPDEPPLLIKILDRFETQGEKIEYVLENIYFPHIRSWTSVFNNTGIILEPHGQNGRVEFVRRGGDYEFTGRIGHLDFDAAVDVSKLDDLGLDTTHLYAGQLVTEDNGHEISTIYDKSIGKMLFDELAKVLQKHYGISPKILQKACKEEFARCFPDFDQYFPELTYRYSDEPIGENSFGYVCTGEAPSWRPSNASEIDRLN